MAASIVLRLRHRRLSTLSIFKTRAARRHLSGLLRAVSFLDMELIKMKLNRQIPNLSVYIALYATIYGISAWVLATDKDLPASHRLLVYLALVGSAFAGVVKYMLHRRRPSSHGLR